MAHFISSVLCSGVKQTVEDNLEIVGVVIGASVAKWLAHLPFTTA